MSSRQWRPRQGSTDSHHHRLPADLPPSEQFAPHSRPDAYTPTSPYDHEAPFGMRPTSGRSRESPYRQHHHLGAAESYRELHSAADVFEGIHARQQQHQQHNSRHSLPPAHHSAFPATPSYRTQSPSDAFQRQARPFSASHPQASLRPFSPPPPHLSIDATSAITHPPNPRLPPSYTSSSLHYPPPTPLHPSPPTNAPFAPAWDEQSSHSEDRPPFTNRGGLSRYSVDLPRPDNRRPPGGGPYEWERRGSSRVAGSIAGDSHHSDEHPRSSSDRRFSWDDLGPSAVELENRFVLDRYRRQREEDMKREQEIEQLENARRQRDARYAYESPYGLPGYARQHLHDDGPRERQGFDQPHPLPSSGYGDSRGFSDVNRHDRDDSRASRPNDFEYSTSGPSYRAPDHRPQFQQQLVRHDERADHNGRPFAAESLVPSHYNSWQQTPIAGDTEAWIAKERSTNNSSRSSKTSRRAERSDSNVREPMSISVLVNSSSSTPVQSTAILRPSSQALAAFEQRAYRGWDTPHHDVASIDMHSQQSPKPPDSEKQRSRTAKPGKISRSESRSQRPEPVIDIRLEMEAHRESEVSPPAAAVPSKTKSSRSRSGKPAASPKGTAKPKTSSSRKGAQGKTPFALPSDTPISLPEDDPVILQPIRLPLSHETISQRSRASSRQPQAPEEEDDLSSDPDDIDVSVDRNLSPEAKIKLVQYMIRLHARKRKVLSRYNKNHERKLARIYAKLRRKYGDRLERVSTPRRKRKRSVDEGATVAPKKVRSQPATPPVVVVQTPVPEETEEMKQERRLRELAKARESLWLAIAKRDVPKARPMLQQSAVLKRQNALKIAQLARHVLTRSKPTKAQAAKELTSRTKRAAKEMLMFWKKNEKEERELRKRAEKEQMELRKREEETREAQRQARKLNFLITQTELYSHFVGKKLDGDKSDDGKSEEIDLGSEGGQSFGEIDFDAEDDAHLKARAAREAQMALAKQLASARAFDAAAQSMNRPESSSALHLAEGTVDQMDFLNPSSLKAESAVEQPRMLTVQLKSYQLKGLNWLAGLWEQGINGILADEMGLGKTIQSISLMAHLAESHNIWGPFLVVSPASTLPNWQQEIARFTPHLKVLPYWGDPDDRKTLRGFLNAKKLGMRDSPFHVAITSYQLIVTDAQQFGRIKWQYMILDEAQAIKSSSSIRWKTLLKLPSRNRLLLTGTPIQNSMQELWSLLHFIMPTLFDSHEEFSEWFSKDIESHVEAGGEGKGLNEEQLRRLHMILKPFMLRRIKRDVENELADKIEVEVPCSLTWRQRELYRRLKSKISVRELLDGLGTSSSSTSSSTNNGASKDSGTGAPGASELLWGDEDGGSDTLMNLVMQFRKVCNHPELFERANTKGPVYPLPALAMALYSGPTTTLAAADWSMLQYRVPRLLWNEAWAMGRMGWKGGRILNPAVVREALNDEVSSYAFLPFVAPSISEFAYLSNVDVVARWVAHLLVRHHLERVRAYRRRNALPVPRNQLLHIVDPISSFDVPAEFPDLCHLAAAERRFSILNRLEMAYLPAAMAAPPRAVASSCSFLTTQALLLYHNRIRALLHHTTTTADPSSLLSSPADRDARHLITSHPHWKFQSADGMAGTPARPRAGWSALTVPSVERLVTDSGKMLILDRLLGELKAGGHRVLIFFQMTLMMDLMEEYMSSRQYSYLRLDGSTSIFDRRDLVNDWQTRPELFVFLLSTRAGGLGINLTAADTVIFYDSDWNPTVDQQAMDRSHRLGQTKQVTVYRLITTGTIEERILQRARQKDQIQKVVISGGEFKQQVEFKPKEVLSLLLDDEEMQEKVRKGAAMKLAEEEEKERLKAAKLGDKATKQQQQQQQQQQQKTMKPTPPPTAASGARQRTRSGNGTSIPVTMSRAGVGSAASDEDANGVDSGEPTRARGGSEGTGDQEERQAVREEDVPLPPPAARRKSRTRMAKSRLGPMQPIRGQMTTTTMTTTNPVPTPTPTGAPAAVGGNTESKSPPADAAPTGVEVTTTTTTAVTKKRRRKAPPVGGAEGQVAIPTPPPPHATVERAGREGSHWQQQEQQQQQEEFIDIM